MIHLVLIFLIIISFEIIKYFKLLFLIKNCLNLYKKLFKLFQFKNVSDIWREKALLSYSKNLLIISVKIILILFIIILLFIILIYINENFKDLILSLFGIIETTILFILYFYVRKMVHAKL